MLEIGFSCIWKLMSFRFKLAIHFEFSDYFVGKVSRVFIQESVISVLKKNVFRWKYCWKLVSIFPRLVHVKLWLRNLSNQFKFRYFPHNSNICTWFAQPRNQSILIPQLNSILNRFPWKSNWSIGTTILYSPSTARDHSFRAKINTDFRVVYHFASHCQTHF